MAKCFEIARCIEIELKAPSGVHRMMTFKHAVLVVVGIAAAMPAASRHAAAAPSFDCKRASTIVEKEICTTADFAKLDSDIAASYTAALAVLSAADADALRADQRAWLKTRDDCGNLIHGDPPIYIDVYGCLRDQLMARAAKLRTIVTDKKLTK
jgi:uncharacterized protein YecT (DUF1311 family)